MVVKSSDTLKQYSFFLVFSFTKQISLQGYFTIYLIGLRLVELEDRISMTFLYIFLTNFGLFLGSIIGGYSTYLIVIKASSYSMTNIIKAIFSLLALILSFLIVNKDALTESLTG